MHVVTAGEVVVDWISTIAGASFANAGYFYRNLGGNATNVAVGLSRLGTPASLIGKVGQDIHGRYLIDCLEREKVDLSFLYADPGHSTAQCYAITDEDGEHIYYNWPRPHAAQMLAPEDIPEKAFDDACLLHTSGISFTLEPRKSAIQKAMQLAHDKHIITSFDANFPTDVEQSIQRAVEEALYRSDLLKFNQAELAYWALGSVSVADMAMQLFEKYRPTILAVTLGENGSYLVTAEGMIQCAPFAVRAVCGVGAGDGFMAGMIHAIERTFAGRPTRQSLADLNLEQWQRIGEFANAVGALVTTAVGATDPLPKLQEVEQLMAYSR
jgi:fructokinase